MKAKEIKKLTKDQLEKNLEKFKKDLSVEIERLLAELPPAKNETK